MFGHPLETLRNIVKDYHPMEESDQLTFKCPFHSQMHDKSGMDLRILVSSFSKEIAILFLGEKKIKEACHFGISIVVSQ